MTRLRRFLRFETRSTLPWVTSGNDLRLCQRSSVGARTGIDCLVPAPQMDAGFGDLEVDAGGEIDGHEAAMQR
jgi:hypothetical protein